MYDLFKFLHILMAVIWVGSGVGLSALTLSMARDPGAMGRVMPHLEALGPKVFGPSSGLTLVFGIVTVLFSKGAYEFSETWILIGFVGFAISGVMTMMLAPRAKRLGALTAEKGHDDPEVAAGARRIINMRMIEILILVAVIAAMVFKPGQGG